MLTDPNVDSPANIDAAVRPLAFLMLGDSHAISCFVLLLNWLVFQFRQFLIDALYSNRKCFARIPKSSERWYPNVLRDHRKWRHKSSTNAPQRVLMDIIQL